MAATIEAAPVLSPTKTRQAATIGRRIARELAAADLGPTSDPGEVAGFILDASYEHATAALGAAFQRTDRGEDLLSDFRSEIERVVQETAGAWADVDGVPAV